MFAYLILVKNVNAFIAKKQHGQANLSVNEKEVIICKLPFLLHTKLRTTKQTEWKKAGVMHCTILCATISSMVFHIGNKKNVTEDSMADRNI